MDDDVRKIDRPIAGRKAWSVGTEGFVVEWDYREQVFTAYAWVPRQRHVLTRSLGCGLAFDEAIRTVRRAAQDGMSDG